MNAHALAAYIAHLEQVAMSRSLNEMELCRASATRYPTTAAYDSLEGQLRSEETLMSLGHGKDQPEN